MILDVNDPGFDPRVVFDEFVLFIRNEYTPMNRFTECFLNYWLLGLNFQSSPFDGRGKLLIRVWVLCGFVRICGYDQDYCEILNET